MSDEIDLWLITKPQKCIEITSYPVGDKLHVKAITLEGDKIEGFFTQEQARMFVVDKSEDPWSFCTRENSCGCDNLDVTQDGKLCTILSNKIKTAAYCKFP